MSRCLNGFSVLLGLLTVVGCGMLDNLENVTRETRDEVRASKQEIGSTKTSQTFGFYHGLLMAESTPRQARADAAKIVLLKAPEDKLPGILAPVNKALDKSAVVVELNDKSFELANVSLVGPRDPALEVIAMPEDFFLILDDAVSSVLLSLRDAATTSGKDDDQRAAVIESFDRMALVASVLYGAIDVATLHEHVFADKPIKHRVDTKKRERVARWIKETAEALHYPNDKAETIYGRVRVRLLEGDTAVRFAFPTF